MESSLTVKLKSLSFLKVFTKFLILLAGNKRPFIFKFASVLVSTVLRIVLSSVLLILLLSKIVIPHPNQDPCPLRLRRTLRQVLAEFFLHYLKSSPNRPGHQSLLLFPWFAPKKRGVPSPNTIFKSKTILISQGHCVFFTLFLLEN